MDGFESLWKDVVTKFLQRLRARIDSTPLPLPPPAPPPASPPKPEASGGPKRYCCAFCPYATDRRDLFTRHESIHREEKPFQCYVCQKQFNRADHVKKHFLRMHRDYPYDLNRIRRQPSKNGGGASYYHKYGNGSPSPGGSNQQGHQMPGAPPHAIHPSPHLHPGLNIPGGFGTTDVRTGPGGKSRSPAGCNARSHGGKGKRKGEKRYACCYCAWSGVDNWCLKRHLNTHLKPFVCGLCDYKAARSERLATHVLKVHNKRACGRCAYLADDQAQLTIHLQEHHPLEHRNNRSSNNILRNVGFPGHPPAMPTSFGYQTPAMVKREQYESSYHQEGRAGRQHWGAARLFHYMEASDTSSQEDDEDEGGGTDEAELPEFVCRECGCEFVDDTSLETHAATHRLAAHGAGRPYVCSVCGWGMASQAAMMDHMRGHSGTVARCRVDGCMFATTLGEDAVREHAAAAHGRGPYHAASKRPRKQSQPRRVPPDSADGQGLCAVRSQRSRLASKHAQRLLTRRRLCCEWCWQDAFPHHTVSSLAFHRLWRHRAARFRCEHCGEGFRHRYQAVLHSSRQHVRQRPNTVPEHDEEPSITTVPAPTETSLSRINVPDLLLHTPEPVRTPPSHLDVPTLCGTTPDLPSSLPSSLPSVAPS
ncbi:zinc finger protein 865-like [Bacillus rossius redtenbacheri]|uniref:zinc finger protein 865-like n=1 Tax=Bacillus rossius redtenbacheri TaxID=93214 RepID=UPI002FDE3E0F